MLEAKITSIDEVSEELRDNYVEQEDGGYILKILTDYVPKEKVENTQGLKSALQKEREAKKEFEKKLRHIREQYAEVDIEKYKEMMDAQAQAEIDAAEKRGEWDKLRAQMVEKHNEDKTQWLNKESHYKQELEKLLIDATATAMINKYDGNVTLLLPHVKSRVKLIEEDGQMRPQVVDEVGTPRVDAEGNPLTIDALVSEMRSQEVFQGAFKGTGQQGGGTPAADPGEGGGKPKGGTPPKEGLQRSKMTPRQKVDYINEHGNDAFMSLPV